MPAGQNKDNQIGMPTMTTTIRPQKVKRPKQITGAWQIMAMSSNRYRSSATW